MDCTALQLLSRKCGAQLRHRMTPQFLSMSGATDAIGVNFMAATKGEEPFFGFSIPLGISKPEYDGCRGDANSGDDADHDARDCAT